MIAGTPRIAENVGAGGIAIGTDPAIGGTPGSVLFVGAGPVIAQDNAQFFWDNTNFRLGIGTNTPASPLDVNGTIRTNNNFTITGRGSFGPGTNSTDARIIGVGNLELGGNSSVQMIITNAGNVGIGTASPAFSLQVITAGTAIASFASSGANNAGIVINNIAGGNQSLINLSDAGAIKWQFGKQSDNSFLLFDVATAKASMIVNTSGLLQLGESQQMNLPSAGNVGIGTTSPIVQLDIPTFVTTNSSLRVGELEFQAFAVGNEFIGENIYYNGTGFIHRTAAAGGLFYFLGSEGQFRFSSSVTSGTPDAGLAGGCQFKVMSTGTVALGGTITAGVGATTGASLVVASGGLVAVSGGLAVGPSIAAPTNGIALDKTITAGTGAQTINKPAGTVNFAAAAGSLVVTNSLVTTSSIIICTIGTNDALMTSVSAVAAAGSFTIFANSAPSGTTRVNFLIIN